ncbi:MAG TPA: peptidoglycan binding domain-containing protein, partial [Gaiellaceae bacterium]
MTEIAALLRRPIRGLSVGTTALVLAFVFALAASALLVRAYTLRESVLPGTRVAGVDVGGLSRADARARIESGVGARLRPPVEISVDGKAFTLSPALIFSVNAAASERLAYDSARGSFLDRLGALAVPFAVKHDVGPVLAVNASALRALEHQVVLRTKRPVSARISMEGRKAVVVPARAGTEVDEVALLVLLRDAALRGLRTIDAPVSSVAPAISTAAAERAAASARTAVSAPVALRFKHKELKKLGPNKIASLIRFQPQAGGYEVLLDRAGLERTIGPLVRRFTRAPKDASFRVVGKRVRVVGARNGTTLDVAGAQESVLAAAIGPGVREARVGLAPLEAKLTTEEANALGIKRQVSTYTTEMGASSSNRIWNVHLMADFIDGTIVKPGKTFSFNKIVGPRTPERGFREGQMIL